MSPHRQPDASRWWPPQEPTPSVDPSTAMLLGRLMEASERTSVTVDRIAAQVSAIDARLARGDRVFEELTERVEDLESDILRPSAPLGVMSAAPPPAAESPEARIERRIKLALTYGLPVATIVLVLLGKTEVAINLKELGVLR